MVNSSISINAPQSRTDEVRRLYEEYPYPSSEISGCLIPDLNNAIELLSPKNDLKGWRVLDAGCGSGHRLVAMAKRFSDAHFIGADMTYASLQVAAALARRES